MDISSKPKEKQIDKGCTYLPTIFSNLEKPFFPNLKSHDTLENDTHHMELYYTSIHKPQHALIPPLKYKQWQEKILALNLLEQTL